MARPQKLRHICSKPKISEFVPSGIKTNESVTIGFDEYEVFRLLDYERFSQEKCAMHMNVSRPTVTRIYDNVRNKIADAFVNGKKIIVEGGDVEVCSMANPECENLLHCCNKDKE